MREKVQVLGVDTSLRSTGVGIVTAQGQALAAEYFGLIRNPPKRLHSACLDHLYKGIQELLSRYELHAVAVEGIFYCKNVRTAMVLGQARGVVLAACAAHGVPVFEYPPRRVKQAIVGTGGATKQQVAGMIRSMLGLEAPPPSDAADALAMAICHIHTHRGPAALAAAPV